jgi:HK97 family phage prohead protease
MTVTIVGVLADELGAASQFTVVPYGGPGRNFDVRHEHFSVSSLHYRSVQAPEVRVDVNHDRVVGRVAYLERAPNGQLHAVAEIDGAGLDGPLYFSPSIRHYDGHDIELRALAVTRSPATVALPAIEAFPGTIADAASRVVYQHGYSGQLIRRARDYDRRRKHGQPLVIQGTQPQCVAPTLEMSRACVRRIEHRSAAAVDVHPAKRELDLLIAPAERPTTIYDRGRSYTEVFSHGAFAGAEQSPERVKVNRDHIRERIVGRAIRLDPWAEAGLEGTVKLAKVHEADEAFALIADDLLSVSAGFVIPRGGDEWHGRDHKRVNRAALDHVALVVEPAYQAAQVMAVRGGSSAPRLDAVLASV